MQPTLLRPHRVFAYVWPAILHFTDPSVGSGAGPTPGSLWGLWDFMIKFDVRLLVLRLMHIEEFEDCLISGDLFGRAHALTEGRSPSALLTLDGRKWLWAHLEPLQAELEPLALTMGKIEIQHLWNHAHVWSGSEMAGRLKEFRSKLERELNGRFFLYLSEEEAALFQSTQPLGQEVASAFPVTVNAELCEASKCLALGRYTACVFHLMHVMEIAVQVFGKKLHVDIVKSAPAGKRVSELSWDQILGAINPKLRALPQDTVKRKRRHEKFAAAQSYLYGVKDAWRNPTMHPRLEGYNELQVRDIMNHVRSFLTEFASLIKSR